MRFLFFFTLFLSTFSLLAMPGSEEADATEAAPAFVPFSKLWESLENKNYGAAFEEAKQLTRQGSFEGAMIAGLLGKIMKFNNLPFIALKEEDLPACTFSEDEVKEHAAAHMALSLASKNTKYLSLPFWEEFNSLFMDWESLSSKKTKGFYGQWGITTKKKQKGVAPYRATTTYQAISQGYAPLYNYESFFKARFKDWMPFFNNEEFCKRAAEQKVLTTSPSDPRCGHFLTLYANYYGDLPHFEKSQFLRFTKVPLSSLSLMYYMNFIALKQNIDNYSSGSEELDWILIEGGAFEIARFNAKTLADQKNPAAAIPYYRVIREKDPNPLDLYNLAYACELQKSFTDAATYLHECQEQGGHDNGWDAVKLGAFYYKGIGVEKDLTKALHYYEKARDRGSLMAFCNLGAFYYNEAGQRQGHMEKAFYNFHEFVKRQGTSDEPIDPISVAKANICLADMYLYGKGTPVNVDQAERLATQAQEKLKASIPENQKDYYGALNILGYCALSKENFKEARGYFERCKAFSTVPDNDLALTYLLDFEATDKVHRKGVKLLEHAAEAGDDMAKKNLGQFLICNEYKHVNLDKAYELLLPLAEQGDIKAQIALKVIEEKQDEKELTQETDLARSLSSSSTHQGISLVDDFEEDDDASSDALINEDTLDSAFSDSESDSEEEAEAPEEKEATAPEGRESPQEEKAEAHLYVKREKVEEILRPTASRAQTPLDQASDETKAFVENFFKGGVRAKLKTKQLMKALIDLGCQVSTTKSGIKVEHIKDESQKSVFTFHHQHKGSHAHLWNGGFRKSLKDFFSYMGIVDA